MCGIIGIISKDNNNVVSDILSGLEKLEYRGYDSAGLAVVGDDGLKRVRAVGKLENLINKLNVDPILGQSVSDTLVGRPMEKPQRKMPIR